MSKLFCLVVMAFCLKDALGATTLTVTTSKECTHNTAAIPSGTGVTVVMTCDMTATVTDIIGDATASIVFKEGADEAFELPASVAAAADVAGGVAFVTNQAAVTATGVTFAAADVNGNLQVTISNFPADATGAAWKCEVKDSDTNTGSVTAEAGQTTGVDLANFCADFTAGTYCGSGVQVLTCTTLTYQLSAWSADATAKLNFRKAGTVKYTLSASNINSGVTTGNLDGTNTGTWSASATTATMVTFTPATAITTADLGNDWTCDITEATGTYNGASATSTITTTACAAYTLSATCTGTTVSALSIGTTGLTFSTFAAGTGFTITVSKGTEERYKLTSDNVAATATNGDLDAASAPIVAGTYAVSATDATTWTFTPTAAIAEADEGSDWRVVVVAGANGGGSGSVSVTCGAEMNKMAGMLVALLVAVKTLLF